MNVDHEQHYFTFGERHVEEAKRIAVFDALINNADRKAGHVLEDSQGQVWAIDHGVCFSPEPKLRSVIWDFAGQPHSARHRGRPARTARSDGRARRVHKSTGTPA